MRKPNLFDGHRLIETHRIVAGIAAVLGHNYTCWLRFKGGKGIATSAGALLAFLPLPLLCALAVWGGVFGIWRYVSLASIGVAVAIPIATSTAAAGRTMRRPTLSATRPPPTAPAANMRAKIR